MAGRGTAASSVAFDSDATQTFARSVIIEPGEGRLYLVLVSDAASIWRLTGAVERIDQVVLDTTSSVVRDGVRHPLEGVSGVTSDKVFFAPFSCLYEAHWTGRPMFQQQHQGVSSDRSRGLNVAETASKVVESATDNSPVVRMHVRNALLLQVPVRPEDLNQADQYPSEPRFVPGRPGPKGPGIYPSDPFPERPVEIEPSSVVASVGLASPVVTPAPLSMQQMLKQLVDKGEIAVYDAANGRYNILRKTELPSGPESSVAFLLKSGVARPDTVPPGACVIDEDTGLALPGSRLSCP